MKIKAYTCPSCGAPLDVNYDTTFTFCPHCGCKIHISYEGEAAPKNPDLRQFTASDTGVPLASAVVPPDYTLKGALHTQWQSDLVPFTATVQAVSPDHSTVLMSSSQEVFEDYLNPMQKRMIASMPGAIKTGFRDFMEPEDYLQQYAQQVLKTPVTPVAKAALPSLFGKNLPGERNALLSYFQSHCININVRIEVANLVCDAILMKFSARLGNRNVVVLAGADWQGVEYFDANRGFAAVMNPFANPLSNLFPAGGGEEPKNFGQWFLQGGLVGQMQRKRRAAAQQAQQAQQAQPQQRKQSSGPIPLGHAKEYGKHVDVIQWGSKRRYLMLAPAEKEQEATEIFLRFVGSLTPEPALTKQESTLVEQMFQTRVMEAQGYAAQAQQMRMQAMQRQMEGSRQIARDSAEISAGIMDSWEKRSASQSRMSANYSEAVRGVNTYTTPTGRTVECDVTADHVYQNRYGDTIGVSGRAVDPEVAAKLDWTELNKK